MRCKCIFFFIVLFVTHASVLFAAEWSGTVTKVITGDSVQVSIDGKQVVIALSDIAAPELEQPFGPEAKQCVEGLALNQKIKIVLSDGPISKNGKISAEIFVPQKQDSLNRILAREGLAWPVNIQKKSNPYELASEFAQKRHLGIWSVPNPIPPWEYKQQEAERRRIAQEKEADQKILVAQIEKEKMRDAQAQEQDKFSFILKKIETQYMEIYIKLVYYIKLYIFKIKYQIIELFEKIRGK